ncbi:hypothetical protein ScPMuIL_014350 [Solemya velum]
MDKSDSDTESSDSDETPSDSPIISILKTKNAKHSISKSKAKVVSASGASGASGSQTQGPVTSTSRPSCGSTNTRNRQSSNQTSDYSSNAGKKQNVKNVDVNDISELDTSSEYILAKHCQFTGDPQVGLNHKHAQYAIHGVGGRTTEDDKTMNMNYNALLLLMTLASFVTRFYNIEIPAHVCWDETHFGKMGSWYINRTFFFDVHPPLGKMLIGLFGLLTGYDGNFPFNKPGDDYGDTNYVGMRMLCALLGTCLVPLAFMSVFLLTKSIMASLFAGCFVLLDTGTLILSRHILLDPLLMFFIMAATFCLLKFLSFKDRPFCFSWFLWMSLTGIFLAAAIGVKFVGLFVILLAGISTAMDLWRLLGDISIPFVDLVKHFATRVGCLIVLPALVYMLIFATHLKVLNKSGNGDGFYSSAFQSQLIGNRLHNLSMPQYLAYGSYFTLKQRRTGGAYLHSHWHLYPEELGPRQQQVTTYSHKDDNNVWIIKTATQDSSQDDPPVLVKSGDAIRLEHLATKRNLHSHKEPAPLSKKHYQVSCYGENGTGDANDVWVIEAIGAATGTPIQTVKTKFNLIHFYVRCALQSHEKKLPKWGWEQLEVSCNPNTRDKKAVWSVEEITDHRLPNVSFELYSPSFFEKIMESHAVMTQGNSGLKPKEGEVTSRPWQWPINYHGQIFSGKDHKIYLLGNPILFWVALGLKPVFLLLYIIHAVKKKRYSHMRKSPIIEYEEEIFRVCWWLLLGWGLHFLPFWPMTRVLYFHHYFPAYLYSSMFSGVLVQYLVFRICLMFPDSFNVTVLHWLTGVVLSLMCYSFYLFSPLAYGMSGPSASDDSGVMHGLKWLESWDI